MHKKGVVKGVVKGHKCLRFTLPRQRAQTAFHSKGNLKCRAASDNNNQNSLYYPIRNAHLTVSYSAHIFMLIYDIMYVGCDFGCKHFQFFKKTLSISIRIFSKTEIFYPYLKNCEKFTSYF